MHVLIGRDREFAEVERILENAAVSGGSSLLVRGDPGIGKSALLQAAARAAFAYGFNVLRTDGIEVEARIPFASLQRLVLPLVKAAKDPHSERARALALVQEAIHGDDHEVFQVALAVLELLSAAAEQRPTLVLVDDAHWLDDATADVLGFVARRLELEPIAMLVSARSRATTPLDGAGLRELVLDPLGGEDAATLLDRVSVSLAPTLRARILELARGNPLALHELPRSNLSAQGVTGHLTLTDRLERIFSERLDHLPTPTRTALLVAALDEPGHLDITLAAAAALHPSAATILAFRAAELADVVSIESGAVRFRHPIARTAVVAAATPSQIRAAHGALAIAYRADGDRSVWHEAAAGDGPDEEIAQRLVRAAERAERRGAPQFAAAARARAAVLTGDERLRGARLIRAAEAELALGRSDVARGMLAQALNLELDPRDRARVSFILEVADEGNWTGADRAIAIARLADDLIAAGDPAAALDALQMIAMRMWWGNPPESFRTEVVEVARRAAARADDPVLLSVLALSHPLVTGAEVRHALESVTPDRSNPATMHLLGVAADAAFSQDLALPLINAAVEGFREQGRLGLLGEALTSQAFTALHLAKASVATTAANEAERLAVDARRPLWAVVARFAQAIVAGEQGDFDRAETLIRDAEKVLMSVGAHPLLAIGQFARGRAAVAHSRYDEGYEYLRRVLDPTDITHHPLVALWCLADLVESTINLNRHDEAGALLSRLEESASGSGGSLLHAGLIYARALTASDDSAQELFQAGLEHGLTAWPCFRGRLLLAYGRWLRRRRRVAESRAPLRAARELFDALGFNGLAENARNELRASGEPSGHRPTDARDQLTPQEMQIAQMAAAGLTNREIGSKLFLSHRTVGSHLYRLFPKLGITSRSQLREALPQAE